ncbi:MAG: hypothetical protein M3O70_17935 [Actinomycetota bacterium]|nr:hypothetical protein [Actinomycetota bacterium]
MILRIMEEGQYELSDENVDHLNEFDDELIAAIEAGDEDAFRHALVALHRRVHEIGQPLPPDHLGPSELVLPPADATLDEVRGLLGEEGLIPG